MPSRDPEGMGVRVALAALLLALVAGCGDDDPPGDTSDCSLSIRTNGITYDEIGFVNGPAQPVGRAELASCDDVGEDARGAYFPDDPRQVDVWSFEGQAPDLALGVLESDDRYRVFVADGEDAAEVLRSLRRSQSGS